MKRKSDSSHYWITTDSGTEYSAKNANARHWQKKAKRDEMRDYYARWGNNLATRELIIPPQVKERYARMKRKGKRRAEDYEPDFKTVKSVRTEDRPKRKRVTEPPFWRERTTKYVNIREKPVFGKLDSEATSSGSSLMSFDSVRRLSNASSGFSIGREIGGLGALAAGGPASMETGELVGGAIGALAGLMESQTSPNNNMPMNSRKKATNMRINKSSMVRSGKAKVKREKKVKVSPYLKQAVKQVISGQQAKGFYQRTFSGLIGSVLNTVTTDGSFLSPQMGIGGQITCYFAGRGTGQAAGSKTWWSGCGQAQNGPTRATGSCLADRDFNFFTPGKIWHLASVLFNNKTEITDPYNALALGGNLKTWFNPIDGNVTNSINATGLKINVLTSKVEIQMKNISARTVEVDMYICVPKLKFSLASPLPELLANTSAVSDNNNAGTETDRSVGWFADGIVKNPTAVNIITEGTIDAPAIYKNMGWQWTYEKCTMVLAPQEVCRHTIKGPSGVLDFSKQINPGAGQAVHLTATKGWSKHLMFAVRPDNVGTTQTAAGTVVDTGSRLLPLIPGETTALLNPISIECEESYRIAVPEIAGFQTVGIAAGAATPSTAQALNFRKTKLQITSLISPNPGFAATQSIVSSTEEDAATVIPTVLQ